MLLVSVLLVQRIEAQTTTETLLSTENAYNTIPSPDGKYAAYVRTGWGRPKGSGGFGRSNLVSEITVIERNGNLVAKAPRVDGFLSGWTSDGTDLVCYRDGEYFLVSVNGRQSSKGRLPAVTNVIGTERVSYLPSAGKDDMESARWVPYCPCDSERCAHGTGRLAGSTDCSVTRRKICRDRRWLAELPPLGVRHRLEEVGRLG